MLFNADNDTFNSGNYSWNFTEENISSVGAWTLNLTNNGTTNFTVQIKLNQTNAAVWDLYYHNSSMKKNISSTSWVSIINMTTNTSKLINLTLDLINISQTYVNWTAVNDTASWPFKL